jgi:hypothetical protein
LLRKYLFFWDLEHKQHLLSDYLFIIIINLWRKRRELVKEYWESIVRGWVRGDSMVGCSMEFGNK